MRWCVALVLRDAIYGVLIEHSENKIITYFENEVGPGVLQSNVQQIYNLQNFTHQGQSRQFTSTITI